MKLLNYLFMVCILVGIFACHDDNEVENPLLPQVSFKEKTITASENAGTLNVSLTLTKAVDTESVIYLAVKQGSVSGGLEGASYATIPASVILAKGVSEGIVTLQIVDNISPNPDCSFDLEIIKVEGNVQINTDLATCRVTIENDDPSNSVRFAGPVKDTVWHEEAGVIEIPLIFTYGTLGKSVSGTIIVDSTYGCSASDFELQTAAFNTNGEDTLKVKVRLVNNNTLGDWGFRLAFKDLKGAWPVTKNYVVKVKDDERILGFKSMTYTVEEGDNVDIISYLYGGIALNNVPLQVKVVPEQTTAAVQQYTLPSSLNAIYARTQSSSFILRTFKHSSKEDKVLALKVTTIAGGVFYDTTQICKVTIKSTDAFVRFAKKTISGLSLGDNNIPLETSGYDEEMTVYVVVKNSNMNASDYKLVSDFAKIPAGLKSGNIQLKLNKAMNPGDEIVLELTRVVLSNSGEANEEMDPDNMICTCKVEN